MLAAVFLSLALLLAGCGSGSTDTPSKVVSVASPAPVDPSAARVASPGATPLDASPAALASPGPGASPGAAGTPRTSAALPACGTTGGAAVPVAEAKKYLGNGPALVVVAALNLRSGPGTECPRVGSMGFGTMVALDGTLIKRGGYVWRHLKGPEGAGYAVADTFQPVPDEQPTHVPILMYHHIADQTSRYFVSAAELNQQMAWLKGNGYISITPADLYNALYKKLPLPAKPVMLTVDDGDPENMEFEQILTKYGFRGVYFLPNYAELSKDDINELASTGEACGHTVTHPDLSKLSDDEQQQEIANNKAWLEGIIGQPVICFAYPFGTYNDDTASIIQDAGYQLAFNAWGPPASLTDPHRWHVPRVEIDGSITLDQFVNAVHNGG